jgi:hypothetical protein
MRCSVAEHLSNCTQYTGDRPEWWVGLTKTTDSVKVTEKLVCAINQLNDHDPQITQISQIMQIRQMNCRSSAWLYVVEMEKEIQRNLRRYFMRVMVMIKANEESEAGVMPSEELLTQMMKFNEQLVKADIMLAGEGLHPSSKGKRVRFSGANRLVIDGPFAETKELIAGFWIWKVKSLEEAVEWVKRCPNPMNTETDVEIRPIFEPEDFGAEFTPELREQEDRLRSKIEQQKS